MASKSPERSDLVEPVNSVMGRGVPCDQIYYDEPLIPALRGNLLLCRWDRTAVTRFPLRPRGATFKAEEIPFLIGSNNGRPTGITADRVGRLFVTTHYLGGNVVVPHCISDLVMITRDDAPAAALGDEVAATADQLWDALSSQSGEGRRRAHNELLRRGDTLRDEAMRRLEAAKEDDLALAHLPWLAAATESDTAATALAAMVRTHPRPEVRLQALRALMTMRQATAHSKLLLEVLDGPSDPARLAVLAWLIDAPTPLSFDTVAALATSTDPYLRQTASTLLARRATLADLEKLAKSENAPTRLAASLAAGIRLTVPLVHEVLPKEVALQYPAGNAFFQRKLRFADVKEPIDLADLGRIGSYTTAQRWKALPPTEEQTKLFNLLMNLLDDPSAPVKSQAAYYLGLTRDPRSEPGVDRVTRELRGGGLAELPPTPVPSAWLAGVFPGGLEDEHPPQKGPIDLAAVYEVQKATIGWKLAEGTEGQFTFDATKYGASFAYFRIQSRSRQPALLTAKAIGTTRVWHNGRSVSLPADGAPTLLDLQPGSNELLIRTNNSKTLLLTIQAKERVTAAAPEKADAALLSERLKSSNVKVGPEFLAVNWEKSLLVGDKDIGRQLFGKLGCAKCHAITADQAGAGAPSLADVGKRFTPTYLVESILTPDKQVADEFRTTILTLTNGQTVSGLLVRETAGDVEMILPDTSRKTVKLADIEERRVSKASPMPSGLLRTPTELRDLLSYMMSERPSPP
ncbi:MAG: c-type cytochrome [Planctomycetes bacterium]|nr:c-type cytochrome [Planctomycetota bacterium]